MQYGVSTRKMRLIQPDDWHVHLRDGALLERVAPDTARQFRRAIVMPNLTPPITTTEQARAYRDRIVAAVRPLPFEPLMTLYLTDKTPASEVATAKASGIVHGIKLYPAGATTHSDAGVQVIANCDAVFAAMEEHDMPLLVHGEVTSPLIDVFDREQVFIGRHLVPLAQRFPRLRIVFEHITTRQAVEFVKTAGPNVAATITPHHLLYSRNAMFSGGIRPHYYCLPVLKREEHRWALVAAATSGSSKFFLGTDSAPHTRGKKEAACGCAGIYSAHAAIEIYAEIFEKAQALDKLEGFASVHGAAFYGLPVNETTITLEKREWRVADQLGDGDAAIVPMRAGETLHWKLAGV